MLPSLMQPFVSAPWAGGQQGGGEIGDTPLNKKRCNLRLGSPARVRRFQPRRGVFVGRGPGPVLAQVGFGHVLDPGFPMSSILGVESMSMFGPCLDR